MVTIQPVAIQDAAASPRSSRVSLVPVLCGLVLVPVLVCVISGSALAPHDPTAQNPLLSVTGPSADHPLGTDQLGRDVLSQLIAGARSAVVGPLVVALGGVLLGTTAGLAGAYYVGIVDTLVNRFADIIYALPALLIAVVVVGIVGGGYWNTALVLLVLGIPFQIRLCRSAAQVQVRQPYVDATRTLGLTSFRTIFRHILPNIAPIVLATFLLDFVGALVGFAALSFLGLGVPAGTPDWGNMLSDGQELITVNPWLSVAPAVMIVLTAATSTLLGDWIHQRLSRRAPK